MREQPEQPRRAARPRPAWPGSPRSRCGVVRNVVVAVWWKNSLVTTMMPSSMTNSSAEELAARCRGCRLVTTLSACAATALDLLRGSPSTAGRVSVKQKWACNALIGERRAPAGRTRSGRRPTRCWWYGSSAVRLGSGSSDARLSGRELAGTPFEVGAFAGQLVQLDPGGKAPPGRPRARPRR